MMILAENKERLLKILITVKTYPIPSSKYDELVCTAGVTETGEFVRLYPINFRDLPFSRQYKKYQWIEVKATQHQGRDVRKESYRPISESIQPLGEPIRSNPGNWRERAHYALKQKARSMEELRERQEADRTSLGIFRPRIVHDLIVSPDATHWKPSFIAALKQARLWETRTASKNPPRKVPFKFQYKFECEDSKCNGHTMMIQDWEVGALFWKLVDKGRSHEEAADEVRKKFYTELCGEERDTHFFVGTILNFPKSWVVIGVFYPKREPPTLFDVI